MSRASERVARVDGCELRVVSERHNSLVHRLEVEAVVGHQGASTPSRKSVAEALARLYSRSPDLVVIRKIETEYGVGLSKVYAHIYDDPERLRSFEPRHLLRRQGLEV